MTPEEAPLALIAFFGFVAVVPVWMWFFNAYATDLPAAAQFLASLVLPATVTLYMASWFSPGGA